MGRSAACGIAVAESPDGERPGALPCQLLDHVVRPLGQWDGLELAWPSPLTQYGSDPPTWG